MNQPQKRSQAERRATTRQALLDAAVDCLLEHGYQNSSLAQIASAAGMTTGAVQHHFQSRKELLQAVISERLFAPHHFDLAAQARKSLQDRCKFLVDNHWQYYANPRYVAIWDIILAARHDKALMTSIKTWQAGGVRDTEKFIRKLFPECTFTPAKLKNLQYFLTSQLRGLALLEAVEDRRPNTNEQLRLLTKALQQMIAGY